MEEGKLPLKQELFVAAYVGEAHGNATESARLAGYKLPRTQGSRLLTNVDIAARIDSYRAEVKASSIAVKENRIAQYLDINDRLWRIVEERAADASLSHVPGGSSGFVVRTLKLAANGDTVEEYQVDTAHEKAIRANMQQLAQEQGEWTNKSELSGEVATALDVRFVNDWRSVNAPE